FMPFIHAPGPFPALENLFKPRASPEFSQNAGKAKVPTLRLSGRSDLRRAHGLCHTEEHYAPLAAAAGRKRLLRRTDAALDVLPIIHNPDISRRANRDVGLPLQATTYVAAWW